MAVAKLLGFDLCPRLQDLAERKLYLPPGFAVPEGIERATVKRLSRKTICTGWTNCCAWPPPSESARSRADDSRCPESREGKARQRSRFRRHPIDDPSLPDRRGRCRRRAQVWRDQALRTQSRGIGRLLTDDLQSQNLLKPCNRCACVGESRHCQVDLQLLLLSTLRSKLWRTPSGSGHQAEASNPARGALTVRRVNGRLRPARGRCASRSSRPAPRAPE